MIKISWPWKAKRISNAKKRHKPRNLEEKLLRLSKTDYLNRRDCCQGIVILGANGSGKSTAPGKEVTRAQLLGGHAVVFFCVKPGDVSAAIRLCKECGRLGDVIFFGPGYSTKFNFLNYELTRSRQAGGGLTENIVDQLLNVTEIRQRRNGGGGGGENAEFFANQMKRILHVTVDTLSRATGSVNVPDILRVITSAPTSKEEFHSPAWRETSFCYQCMAEAVRRRNAGAADEYSGDLEVAAAYWSTEFPALGDRTRASVVSTVTGTLDSLQRGFLKQFFGEETNFTPEALTREGKILINTASVLEYGEAGIMQQVILKFAIQKAVNRRSEHDDGPVVAFIMDEFQTLCTSADSTFAGTCRSAGGSMILMSQNLPTIYAAMGGGDKARQDVDSLLGNMNIKILCANSDPTTTDWSARLLGKSKQFLMNASTQRHNDYGMNRLLGCTTPHGSAGVSEIWEFAIQPADFSRLRTGGPANDYCVDTIMFRTGMPFNSTGENWMRVTFSQK